MEKIERPVLRVESQTRQVASQRANLVAAKMNSFSIEAILAAPHPKKERKVKTAQRAATQVESRREPNSALSTLETFASHLLTNHSGKEVLESELKKRSSESGTCLKFVVPKFCNCLSV